MVGVARAARLVELRSLQERVDAEVRRAIVLRDEQCQFPRCRAPATWCDVHHLLAWILGGETNLENCALLCRRHHVAVQEGGWKLVRGPDGLTLAA